MPSALPDGEPMPDDGALPESSLATVGQRGFGVYVHVPFCRTRCGYCDFNTYTADELGAGGSRAAFADTAIAELRLARRVLGERDLPVATVFFGGGTPTVLPPGDLVRILRTVDAEFGLASDAEVTVEANPDTVDEPVLAALREGGINRLSLGMQSAVPHVLRVLERTHQPRRVPAAVAAARRVGFASVSLDVIYGTPGESPADWRATLDAVAALGPDHVSAYALIVEPGTRLAAQVRRGELPAPDDDDLADKYALANRLLARAGYEWYEVSNWARGSRHRSRHNLGYWRDADWWGIGPGAHSHVGGVRWWNVKHPAAYAVRLAAGRSPAQAREVLDEPARRLEQVLLGMRLAEGLPLTMLPGAATARLLADGLLDPGAYGDGRAALTLRGRLLADAVVRQLAD